jgi:hypothetical protein
MPDGRTAIAVEPTEQGRRREPPDLGRVLGHHGDPRDQQVRERDVVEPDECDASTLT